MTSAAHLSGGTDETNGLGVRGQPADLWVFALLLGLTLAIGKPFSKLGVHAWNLYVTELAILIIAVLAVARVGVRGSVTRIRARIPTLPLAIFWAAGAIAFFRGIHAWGLSRVSHDVGMVEYSVFLPLVALVIDSPAKARLIVRVLLFAGLLATVIFTPVYFLASPSAPFGQEHNPTSAIALAMCAGAGLAAAQALYTSQLVWWQALIGVLGTTVTILLGERSLVVALIAGALVLILVAPLRRRRVAAWASTTVVAASFGFAWALTAAGVTPSSAIAKPGKPATQPTVVTRVEHTFTPNDTSGAAANARWRLAIAKYMVRQTTHQPIIGVGFGKPTAFRWHGILYDARRFDTRDPNDFTGPHDSYVNLLYRTGILGFVPFVVLVAFGVVRGLRAIFGRNLGERTWVLASVAVVFTLVAVSAFFNVVLEGPYMGVVFWTTLGFILVLPCLSPISEPSSTRSTRAGHDVR